MEVKENPTMEIQILETAEKLFLEKGFASTSTTEIAREVGCNQALVHYYFRTKENLFNTIFEQKLLWWGKTISGALAPLFSIVVVYLVCMIIMYNNKQF